MSLSAAMVLRRQPFELEKAALEFVVQLVGPARQEVMPVRLSFCDSMQRQLTARVVNVNGDGLLSPDVWRLWLPMFEPGLLLILLQVSASGGMRPKAYRVPGVKPT